MKSKQGLFFARRFSSSSPSLSFSRTLGLYFFSYTALSMLIISIALVIAFHATNDHLMKENVLIIAEKTALEFSTFIDDRLQLLEVAARINDLEKHTADNIARQLSAIFGNTPEYRQTAVYDSGGTRLGYFGSIGFNDQRLLPSFLPSDLLKKGQIIRDISLDTNTGEVISLISYQADDAFGQTRLVIIGELNLRFMWDLIGAVKLGQGGRGYIIDDKGIILASSDMTEALYGVKRVVFPGMDAGVFHRYDNESGIDVIAVRIDISDKPWSVVVEIPYSEFHTPLVEQALLALFVSFFLAIAAGLAGMKHSASYSKPLSTLTEAVVSIERGSGQPLNEAVGFYEIDTLAKAFNRATAKLNEAIASLKQKNSDLESTYAKLRAANKSLHLSVGEKEGLIKELHHRVKNNIQMVSSLLDMQTAASDCQFVSSCLGVSRLRVKAIALLQQQLYIKGSVTDVEFSDYLSQLVGELAEAYDISGKNISYTLETVLIMVPADKAQPLALISHELIGNAFLHAFSSLALGKVRICLELEEPNLLCLVVEDNGIGLPEHLNPAEATSLGFSLIFSLVQQIHGEIKVRRGLGTAISVRFPV